MSRDFLFRMTEAKNISAVAVTTAQRLHSLQLTVKKFDDVNILYWFNLWTQNLSYLWHISSPGYQKFLSLLSSEITDVETCAIITVPIITVIYSYDATLQDGVLIAF